TPPLAPLATVMTNRNVAATDNPAPLDYQGEVQVSVNRNNANQIVAGANTWDIPAGCEQTQAIFSSSDSGNTWNYTCAPSVGDYGLSCPDDGIAFGSDPAVYWDNNNKVFLNYLLLCCDFFCQLGLGNPSSSLAVARSDNGGTSWVGHGIVVDHLSGTGGLDDKEFYVIDNNPLSPHYGRHYECWDNDNNELVAYSDNGINWTIKD